MFWLFNIGFITCNKIYKTKMTRDFSSFNQDLKFEPYECRNYWWECWPLIKGPDNAWLDQSHIPVKNRKRNCELFIHEKWNVGVLRVTHFDLLTSDETTIEEWNSSPWSESLMLVLLADSNPIVFSLLCSWGRTSWGRIHEFGRTRSWGEDSLNFLSLFWDFKVGPIS